MFSCVSIKSKDIRDMEALNDRRMIFNEKNLDFFETYYSIGYAQQIFFRKRVKILKYDTQIIGFIWYTPKSRNNCIINCMYVNNSNNIKIIEGYACLLNSIINKYNVTYTCLKNTFNFDVLEKLGFEKKEGTLELTTEIKDLNYLFKKDDITFEIFRRGIHENVRCLIQNDIFKNSKRVPLTIEDIYYDELQSYYFEKGSVLVKCNNDYIGYGQIIVENNKPTIVNFGIKKEFRRKGFGKELLYYLLKILKDSGFENAFIRVKSDNAGAIELYTSVGFKLINETFIWGLEKKH